MTVTLTPAAYYALRHIVNKQIVPIEVWCKWDQRVLRGLYRRDYIKVNSLYELRATNKGWYQYTLSLNPRLRKDFSRPVFGNRRHTVNAESIRRQRHANG